MSIPGHRVTGRARADGRWQVTLPELPARSEPMEIKITASSGSERIIRNVLVGEVWLCTGPSNIQWPVRRCDDAEEETADAKYPEIRFFTVKRAIADQPQTDCVGNWSVCSPETVGDVSGVGYFFARRIHRQQAVPVALLQGFWGGTRTEAWTSTEAVESQPALGAILKWWDSELRDYDSEQADSDYQRRLESWQRLADRAGQEGTKAPARPKKPTPPQASPHRPGVLFNGMVAPLIPYGIRGAITYQGLGNLYWAQHSRILTSTLIRDWRSRWSQGPFPFGMAQPAPYPCEGCPMQLQDAYSLLREAEVLVLDDLPNTGLAPTMDLGDLEDLHFTNKQDVGRRLAQWALATVYGRDVPYSGPIYSSMTIEDGKIRINFSHAAGGLSTSDGLAPSHFTIAGEDNIFHPAQVVIEGDTVVVDSTDVAEPIAVRFAWSDTAIPNLVNAHGLPASIFRTDLSSADVHDR